MLHTERWYEEGEWKKRIKVYSLNSCKKAREKKEKKIKSIAFEGEYINIIRQRVSKRAVSYFLTLGLVVNKYLFVSQQHIGEKSFTIFRNEIFPFRLALFYGSLFLEDRSASIRYTFQTKIKLVTCSNRVHKNQSLHILIVYTVNGYRMNICDRRYCNTHRHT